MNRKSLVTIITLAGFASLLTASILVQMASATTDGTTRIMGGQGEEEATTNGNNNTITNIGSNVTLGSLFHSGRTIEETFNPVNETYFVLSYVDSITLMPPNAPGVVINATERGNLTINVQPNGLSIDQGQGFIMTEGDDGQEETATVTFVALGRTDAEGTTGSSTGVAFYSTNSTGQLAFLDNMVGIFQLEFTPEESTIRTWEWKGGTLAPIVQ
ncbi:MAG: hypothetical protein M3115_02300 [Thermoproteota archaeon]|nr:hypothetical protein [Thermoproteota archaeon]